MSSKFSAVLLQHGRALEWLTSGVLLGFAAILALPGDTLMSSPAFGAFVAAGIDEASLSMPLAAVAAMRMAGLYINGAWRKSPILRAVGAIVGAGVFWWLSAMIALPYLRGEQAAASTGMGVYPLLALADLVAAYRSGADYNAAKRAV